MGGIKAAIGRERWSGNGGTVIEGEERIKGGREGIT
jgi:hypothetical protein